MGISIWQLLIILAIVLVLFGAKRLRNVGGDLGAAIKGFKESVKDESAKKDDTAQANVEHKDEANKEGNVFDAQAEKKDETPKDKA